MKEKDPIKNAMGILYRTKVIGLVFGLILSIALFLVLVLMLIVAMYPIVKGGQILAGVSGFWDRLSNTFTMKCFFCTTTDLNVKKEKQFYNKVNEINDDYLAGKSMPHTMSVFFIRNGGKAPPGTMEASPKTEKLPSTSVQLDIPLLLSSTLYTHDAESVMFEGQTGNKFKDAASGDILGDVSFYADEGDQYNILWHSDCETCYIKGYYYDSDRTPRTASRLRQHGKHQVRRDREGVCMPEVVVNHCVVKWRVEEWYSYHLDISPDDTLYTMEFDQAPYVEYRTYDEVWGSDGKRLLPPTFITYLIAKYFPKQFETRLPTAVKDLSHSHLIYLTSRKTMKNMIYSYKKGYEYLVGNVIHGFHTPTITDTNCTYEINKTGNNGSSVDSKTVDASNIKVKLLQCGDGNRGEAIPGEELIDLEKYILGVTYAEIGDESPSEAQKAEAIAARSYALTRGTNMDATYLKMYQENGQWILPIRNCTEDQVYCDPDKGCTVKNGGKNQTSKTVYSGTIAGKSQYKSPLPADAPIRKAVAETVGQVLVDKDENIYYSDYTDTQHQQWIKGAKAGKDAYQLLVATYGSDKTLKANCVTTAATGDWAAWKQSDPQWAGINLGNGGSTLGGAGCAVTSIAKLIAMSGTKVTIDNFNPGTMVEYLNSHGGFSGSAINWGSISSSGLAPNFVHGGTVSLSGSEQQKAAKIKEYLDQGYYIVLKVRDAATVGSKSDHWVAVTGVTGNNIVISDPSSDSTTAWPHYNSRGTIKFNYYKKTD